MWFDRLRSVAPPRKTADLALSYPPRSTRFPLDVPVSFVEEECRYEGQCINVSQSGLLARFTNPPELWTQGKVEIETGEHYLNIHVRVARLEDNDIGFAFCLHTENDRAAIDILISSVSRVLT